MCISVRVYICTCVCMDVCTYRCAYICMSVYLYARISVRAIGVYMFVCIFVVVSLHILASLDSAH